MEDDLKNFLQSRVHLRPEEQSAFEEVLTRVSSSLMVLAHKVYCVNELPKLESTFNLTVNDEGNIEITINTSMETTFDNADFCDKDLKSLAYQYKIEGFSCFENLIN
ncbi:hypothetical protein EKK58_11350 [Candidatus Dependentiae bacterium]|nr:MAG: hypothetical protein EKK58_11350 [Candidatus Dependentiae bacterium]